MLHELRVENLLLIERAELRLVSGLNVLTGETGTGKTMLAHALDLLLGGRARAGIVRAGAQEAYVEGVFDRPDLPPGLAGRIPPEADELVLARRVWADGRTRAYVSGRAATVGDLRELGARLLAFYGQHEHRKLMLASAQLEILDGYCGAEELRGRVGAAYERMRRLGARLEQLRGLAGARERELDLIRFELEEIEAAAPSEQEQSQLLSERERLRHLEMLRGAAAGGVEALVPEEGAGGVAALAQATAQLEPVGELDPALAPLVERLAALRYEAEDLGGELRRYLLGLEAEGDGNRLEQVEERLALFARLERKHGGTIEDVLGHAGRCRARLQELEHAEVTSETVQRELDEARDQMDALASDLGARRRAAAPKLAAAVRARLAELAMPDARFEVEVRRREEGCGPRGADVVELMIAPNPGIPAGPLREIASGGELSRVMLALLSVAHGGDGVPNPRQPRPRPGVQPRPQPGVQPLLAFDEVDAGIGGHTARAVGKHLRDLASGRQILCITHLPQVAALASRHFTISKDAGASPARTVLSTVEGDEVVGELVRMLGADKRDRGANQHARELLQAA
jgi:DNA repair protein RecN (Recombination protein N)